jgi:ATP-dependent DNA helicase DinG
MSLLTKAFAVDGLLANIIENFAPRDAQVQLAGQVEAAIKQKSLLIAEAGTGTGKTFAYLLPALTTAKKIIISTGTKNLQEQLFYKDLPLLAKAIPTPRQIALLKGRTNYLCLQRLELYSEQLIDSRNPHQYAANSPDKQTLADLVKVRRWAGQTRSGDLSEMSGLAEDSQVFPYVTSSQSNCLAKDCPQLNDCYLVKARKKAMDSDVVVVNHHLFFADMALKDTGFGELIPNADTVIFDEAHQLPEIACSYFGEALSTRQLLDLCQDCLQEYALHLGDVKQLQKAAQKLSHTIENFRLLFPQSPERGNWRDKLKQQAYRQRLAGLHADLEFLYEVLKSCLSRTEVIDNCFERASQLLTKLGLMSDDTVDGVSLWYETSKRHLMLHQTPLSVADKFSDYISASNAGWIFTSATLAVNEGFEHFSESLGLANAKCQLLDSPFNYAAQSLLVVPRYLPQPYQSSRAPALVALAKPLIKASGGSCFMLFTSYRMMNEVARLLAEQIDNPLLVQGQQSKRILLEAFITNKEAVLLATASFWEGVDVRGDKLTCVIIDKLPFGAPDDPLLQARMDDVKRRDGDPFTQTQLPQAVINLKQGVGRLIRDVSDKGVMVICDDRLVNRPYGQVFLSSLPPMRRSRDLTKAVAFLNQIHGSED